MSWPRFKEFCFHFPTVGLSLDLSRLPFPDDYLPSIEPKFAAAFAHMAALEKGAIANPDENRMVGHYWLRAPALAPSQEIADAITSTLAAIKQFAAKIHQGEISGPAGKFRELLVIGIGGSALFSVTSTATSDGAVNSSHDSFTPISGLVQIFNLTSGEVIFGGVGTGIVSMIFIVVVTIFIAGLLVGRTPEYLGKKIEAKEMKMVMLSFVATGATILVFAGATFLVELPKSSYWNPAGALTENLTNLGAHGLSEVLYANASAVATNGSAFAGLNANSPWFNVTLGVEMLIGRFLVIIPALAIAGSLALKKRLAVTGGTMPTHGPLFAALLLGTIILVTALTFFPALSLGPIAEHYLMHLGTTVR